MIKHYDYELAADSSETKHNRNYMLHQNNNSLYFSKTTSVEKEVKWLRGMSSFAVIHVASHGATDLQSDG